MLVRFKEVFKPRKVKKDKLPLKKFKSGFRANYVGDFDDSVEPSYLQSEIKYYADPPESIELNQDMEL